MSIILNSPIIYLKCSDFTKSGRLRNPYFKDKLVIIFIHANYCVYCIDAKPEFQRAADHNQNQDIVFAAIQADNDHENQDLCRDLFPKLVKNFEGFPSYAFISFGRKLPVKIRGRDANSLLRTLEGIYTNYY